MAPTHLQSKKDCKHQYQKSEFLDLLKHITKTIKKCITYYSFCYNKTHSPIF